MNNMTDKNTAIQVNTYLKKLLLFPIDIQDKIIEDISYLNICNGDTIANVLSRYTAID